jgi:hypothetical protein
LKDKPTSKNSLFPKATLAVDIGLSEGTRGFGKPSGIFQSYSFWLKVGGSQANKKLLKIK